ncbi:hypothetical protein [Desulfobacula sp.]|uniref:hypothetical protein n=1 Tax=Desulfobacula sp. TaxID=2593537 RepID=UPI002615E83A|nr:hypothetical protein [Desulfobacula sp.]
METFFLRNPWFRAFFPLLLLGVASVSASSLVVEISVSNGIVWSLIPQKVSFYILLISTIFLALYQIKISMHDRDMIKGFTPKQYEAAIRNKVAEGVAKRSLKLIQNGEIDQLEQETETFKKLYGEVIQ